MSFLSDFRIFYGFCFLGSNFLQSSFLNFFIILYNPFLSFLKKKFVIQTNLVQRWLNWGCTFNAISNVTIISTVPIYSKMSLSWLYLAKLKNLNLIRQCLILNLIVCISQFHDLILMMLPGNVFPGILGNVQSFHSREWLSIPGNDPTVGSNPFEVKKELSICLFLLIYQGFVLLNFLSYFVIIFTASWKSSASNFAGQVHRLNYFISDGCLVLIAQIQRVPGTYCSNATSAFAPAAPVPTEGLSSGILLLVFCSVQSP